MNSKNEEKRRKDFFGASHLIILVCYTIMSFVLVGESFLLGWETWALILLVAANIISWTLHIRQSVPVNTRIWIYAVFIEATSFFYGTHVTSTFDLGYLMALIILIFVSTGISALVTMSQMTYYLAFAYDMYQMYRDGEVFDSLLITRAMLHIVLITVVGYIARAIINKWNSIMNESEDEKEALADAAERLNDFLTNISHELRTPVNAVTGLTGISIEREQDAEIKKNLLMVSEAGKRVGDLIDDILDHSEIDMGSVVVNEEEYMLSSLLNDMVTDIASRRKLTTELVIDVDPTIPSVMSTDVGKLKKILRHLIDNGLKYTREGGVYVHITAEDREYGINLLIEVQDTGIGMNAEELEKVFDSFYQADSGRTRSTSGLGLGLSIVNGFTTSLKGFLTIESEEGKGTTVRVSLPQRVVDADSCMSLGRPERLCIGAYLRFEKYPNPHVREFYNSMVRDLVIGLNTIMQRADSLESFKQLAKAGRFTHVFVGKEEYEEDPDFFDELAESTLVAVVADQSFVRRKGSNVSVIRKPFYCFPVISFLDSDMGDLRREEGRLSAKGVRALVVDDEYMNHMVAREILGSYDMTVLTALSGPESIRLLREKDVDIIFMDHMMPGMDGVETMKRIRTELSRERKDVPIVALTANAVSTAREMFLREGFDAFLAKPIEIIELERVLKKVLPKSLISVDKQEREEQVPGDKAGGEQTEELKTEEVKPKEEENEFQALQAFGIDVSAGISYSGEDADFYKELVLQYASEASMKIKNTEAYLKAGDLKNYGILVHAVKSTSKMIGAAHISEGMLELEKAAKAGDAEFVSGNHAAVMEEYKKTAEGILSCFGKTPEKETAGEDDEVMEFGPGDDDEVMEFAPEGGED